MAIKKKIARKPIDKDLPKMTFIETDYRKFIQVDLDFAGNKKLLNQELNKLFPDITNAIVYINIRICHEDVPRLNIEQIKEICSEAYILRPITPIIVKEIKIRNEHIKTEESLQQNAKYFLDKNNPKFKDKILKKFNSIIEGESIEG